MSAKALSVVQRTHQGRMPQALAAAAGRSWTRWLDPLISLALLTGVLREYSHIELRADSHLFDVGIAFWSVFILYYLSTPLCEWLIYRGLLRIPNAGTAALLRKEITNDLLLGYLGEFYFYTWARQWARLVASLFGAIKDVTILSAVVSNVLTMAFLLLGIAYVENLPPGPDSLALKLSVTAFVVAAILRLFSGVACSACRLSSCCSLRSRAARHCGNRTLRAVVIPGGRHPQSAGGSLDRAAPARCAPAAGAQPGRAGRHYRRLFCWPA